MTFKDLVLKNRSYRRFYQSENISEDTLMRLVDLARVTPSAANKQPLRYVLIIDSEKNALVYRQLAWAGYIQDWDGPEESERPSAYIIILGDKRISGKCSVDSGIAAQTILLGAAESGLGGCMIGSVNRPELAQALKIPGSFEILLVIALGKPKEEVVLTEIENGGDIQYWRDKKGIHYVPKRTLSDIIYK